LGVSITGISKILLKKLYQFLFHLNKSPGEHFPIKKKPAVLIILGLNRIVEFLGSALEAFSCAGVPEEYVEMMIGAS
tara:strand:+ start:16414 stop:16644 length:231 start_codon:yes stop_codon:yes gene_type:complete